MYHYGLNYFTYLMVGISVLTLLYAIVHGIYQKKSFVKIIKVLLQTIGMLFAVYVVIVILMTVIFYFLDQKECSPNSRDVEIMKPQAEVITQYILKNGLPNSMKEISNLPYKWDRCEKESKNVEYCYFNINQNKYRTRLYSLSGNNSTSISIKIYHNQTETGIYINIEQPENNISKFEVINRFVPYSTKNDGICSTYKM